MRCYPKKCSCPANKIVVSFPSSVGLSVKLWNPAPNSRHPLFRESHSSPRCFSAFQGSHLCASPAACFLSFSPRGSSSPPGTDGQFPPLSPEPPPLSCHLWWWRDCSEWHFTSPSTHSFPDARCARSVSFCIPAPSSSRSSLLTAGSCCPERLQRRGRGCRQVTAVQGQAAPQTGSGEDLRMGRRGHGVLESSSGCCIAPFPSLQVGKCSWERISAPRLYFYNPCAYWNIEHNSQPDRLYPVLLPSYSAGDVMYLTWILRSAWL